MSGWLRPKRRRIEDTMTPVTPTTTPTNPLLNDIDRHDPTVRALTAASDGKPLPLVPSVGR